ncbi:MAG: hypothetical protein AN484_27480 [Aphanizomenon flos-aquae WA102]|uniref:Uncharacterized protein n=1 Tax=Aphanizomenon flos-aquae WA102 TaxID=1710896 RepID=A0A1B7W7E2_APHFL|nr:MAG: hypothetical protein AN484_27480 [Aphanizomenon flos-aquae WA102]
MLIGCVARAAVCAGDGRGSDEWCGGGVRCCVICAWDGLGIVVYVQGLGWGGCIFAGEGLGSDVR